MLQIAVCKLQFFFSTSLRRVISVPTDSSQQLKMNTLRFLAAWTHFTLSAGLRSSILSLAMENESCKWYPTHHVFTASLSLQHVDHHYIICHNDFFFFWVSTALLQLIIPLCREQIVIRNLDMVFISHNIPASIGVIQQVYLGVSKQGYGFIQVSEARIWCT